MTARHEVWVTDGAVTFIALLGLGLILSIFSRAVLP